MQNHQEDSNICQDPDNCNCDHESNFTLQAWTFGIVHLRANKKFARLTLKFPILGLKDTFINFYDYLRFSPHQGVWIGKRALGKMVGLDSNVLNLLKISVAHWVTRINGIVWHLSMTTEQQKKLYKIEECKDDWAEFQWVHKGKAHQNVGNFIQEFNKSTHEYRLVLENCQDVAMILYLHARGIYDLEKSLTFFDKTKGTKWISHFANDFRNIFKS